MHDCWGKTDAEIAQEVAQSTPRQCKIVNINGKRCGRILGKQIAHNGKCSFEDGCTELPYTAPRVKVKTKLLRITRAECIVCNKEFATKQNLKRHKTSKKHMRNVTKIDVEKKLLFSMLILDAEKKSRD